jgi:hypothetical protein
MSKSTNWQRSSFCAAGECAEIKVDGQAVFLRNSTRPESTIELTKAEWEALKKGILAGEF